MLYYLDTNVVIYAVQGQPPYQQRARDYLDDLEDADNNFAVSALTWMECLIRPLRTGDGGLLIEYQRFMLGPIDVPLTSGVFQRAALVRASYRFSVADSIHLAAAVENRCDCFLTNDVRLAGFPDITVEVLP